MEQWSLVLLRTILQVFLAGVCAVTAILAIRSIDSSRKVTWRASFCLFTLAVLLTDTALQCYSAFLQLDLSAETEPWDYLHPAFLGAVTFLVQNYFAHTRLRPVSKSILAFFITLLTIVQLIFNIAVTVTTSSRRQLILNSPASDIMYMPAVALAVSTAANLLILASTLIKRKKLVCTGRSVAKAIFFTTNETLLLPFGLSVATLVLFFVKTGEDNIYFALSVLQPALYALALYCSLLIQSGKTSEDRKSMLSADTWQAQVSPLIQPKSTMEISSPCAPKLSVDLFADARNSPVQGMRQYGIQPTFQVGLDSTYKMPDDDDRSVYSGTSAGFTTRWNEAPNAMSRFSADSRGNSPFAAFAMPKFGRQGVALPERPRQSRAQGQISPPRPKHTRGDTLHPSDQIWSAL